MAACVLCQLFPRLHLRSFSRTFSWSRRLCRTTDEDEAEDQKGKKGAFQTPEASVHRSHYNPSSYHQSKRSSAASGKQKCDDEDYRSLASIASSLFVQSRRDRVKSSRQHPSVKNTHLDLILNKDPDPRSPPSLSTHHRKSPELKPDQRAFLRSRPEYASMSLDLTQRPEPIPYEDVSPLLQKVFDSKGKMTPSDLVQCLTEVSRLDPDKMVSLKSNKRFWVLLHETVEKRSLMTEAQLLEVLQSLVWLNVSPLHKMLMLYEEELCCRAKRMTLHELLLAADLWRCIRRRPSEFLEQLYDLVPQYLRHMGTPELVLLLYTVGENRWCPANLIRPLQHLIMRHLFDLNPEEVGIVCLSLFKSKTAVSWSVVNSLVEKAHSRVSEMSDFAVVNMLKYLRYSYLYDKAWMEAMAQEIPLRAPRMGISGLMHVMLACSALHYRNDDILVAVADRVPSQVSLCRSKDSCKLLWAFGTLRFLPAQSQSLYPSLTEAMRQKKEEFQKYPEHLITGLLGLAFVSQFPEDLIAFTLSPDFVKLALKSSKMDLKNDLVTLDGIVALELPQWTGPRLSHELREEVAKRLWIFAQTDLCLKQEVQVAESTLRDLLGGQEFVCKRMILPHTRSIDLEVHLDPSGEPIPVNPTSHITTLCPANVTLTQGWEEMNAGSTFTTGVVAQRKNNKSTETPAQKTKSAALIRDEERSRFDTNVQLTSGLIDTLTKDCRDAAFSPQGNKSISKLAIQVTNKSQVFVNSPQLLGFSAMKRRHLTLAGYKVVELNMDGWLPIVRKSKTEKLAYMHCKVFDSL